MNNFKKRHGWIKNKNFPRIILLALLLILNGCSALIPLPSPISETQESADLSKEAFSPSEVKAVDSIFGMRGGERFQKLHKLVWFFDGILIFLVLLLGFGIIVLSLRKQVLETRRKRILSKFKKELQNPTRKGPSELKNTLPTFAATIHPGEFVEIAKGFGMTLPTELEEYFRNFLLSSGKIEAIEHQAKSTRNKWRQIEAIICLGYVGSDSALEILKKALGDQDLDISYSAMLALSRIKTQASARALLYFLGKHKFSGHKIVSILEGFPPVIIEDIFQVIEHSDATVRFWAVKLLSKFKPTNEWRKIEAMTQDDSPNVRAAACECLGRFGKREAKAALFKCLDDKIWFVRMQAVRALSQILGAECVPQLIQLVAEDPSVFVKESIKNAILSDIEKALPYIAQCLHGDDQATKKYCIDALVDSNHISKMLTDILSRDVQIRSRATYLLEGLVKSKVYFGLKKSLEVLVPTSQDKVLKVIAEMDEDLARRIAPSMAKKFKKASR